jgi:hypothetical protein
MQDAAEHYLVGPIAMAESVLTARAAGLDTLQIMYREGDGSEFVVNCWTTHDLVDTNTLFTEDVAQFERFQTTDCVGAAMLPAE